MKFLHYLTIPLTKPAVISWQCNVKQWAYKWQHALATWKVPQGRLNSDSSIWIVIWVWEKKITQKEMLSESWCKLDFDGLIITLGNMQDGLLALQWGPCYTLLLWETPLLLDLHLYNIKGFIVPYYPMTWCSQTSCSSKSLLYQTVFLLVHLSIFVQGVRHPLFVQE